MIIIVYNEAVHWNSLTDGRMKYIFRAYFADEQLFDLEDDPEEGITLLTMLNGLVCCRCGGLGW